MSSDDLEIVHTYISETRELLDQAELALLELQRSPGPDLEIELVHSIFRCFHSVKGAAAMLGFEHTARITHAAESILAAFRKRRTGPSQEVLAPLLETVDLVRSLTDLNEAEKPEGTLATRVDELCGQLHRVQTDAEAPTSPGVAASQPAVSTLDRADFVGQFAQESQELLGQVEAVLLAIHQSPSEHREMLQDAFRAMHSLKGNCGFMGYAELERLSHRTETLLEVLQSGPPEQLEPAVQPLLHVIDVLRTSVTEITGSGGPRDTKRIANTVRAAEELLAQTTLAARVDRAPKPVTSRAEETPIVPLDAQRQDVRVDLKRLDAMVNLASELVIAETMVLEHPALSHAEDEKLARAVHMLRRVAIDIQDLAMALRMVPLSGVFKKLARVVHDVSRRVNKQVRLELAGEETEVDKSVLELLSDPLVHLVRNAIDHGLESAEERRHAGKPAEGTITIEARHAGGEVLVVVRDDGRGLARQKILEKGIERGLVTGNRHDLTDQQVFQLIFEAGFSTAATVTDVSGRGVGMDVVRSNIAKLKGTVELRSQAGRETAVVLHIPLTVAIIDGMLVRVGSTRYTLPLLAIREALRPDSGQITVTPDGREVARIREELIPVVRLHEVLRRPPDHHLLQDGILIVTESQGRTTCLFADEILGQHQAVIKALSGYFRQTRGVSGCTILGDGEVSLILDVAALVALSQGFQGKNGGAAGELTT